LTLIHSGGAPAFLRFFEVFGVLLFCLVAILFFSLLASSPLSAQTTSASHPASQPSSQPKTDSLDRNNAYLVAAIGGFIPTGESYRLNYSTKTAGLPIELSGGFLIPIGPASFVPLTVRYLRREANFVDGTSISVLSIEPGIRFFLEPQHDHDLRLFGDFEVLLADASVSGSFYIDSGDTASGTGIAQKDYYNLGIGLDLGLTAQLTGSTALDAFIHIAVYMASPIQNGGIGNIGGISLVAAYRFGF